MALSFKLVLTLLLLQVMNMRAAEIVKPVPPMDPVNANPWMSSPNQQNNYDFTRKVMNALLTRGIFFHEESELKAGPFDYKTPNELKSLIDVKLGEEGTPQNKLVSIIETLIKYSPHPSHPMMLDKRVSGLDPYALAGDWMAATMSNLVVTYHVSPIWTLMELEMTRKLSRLIGWSKDGDGVPTTGAGVANSMALSMALASKYPNFKEQGLFGRAKKPVIFLSEHASYGWEKAAAYQGLGFAQLLKIQTDSNGRMDIRVLKAQIQAVAAEPDNMPIMVVGTAGTQVLGQIDPLDKIADVCKSFGLWFHVDAEKGGGYLFSDSQKTLKGITNANSVTIGSWMLSTPYVSTILMSQDPNMLHKCFGLHAPYVWTGLDLYDVNYDTGDHTIQTSRRPEISKFWFMWQGRGSKGLQQHVERTKAARNYLMKRIREKSSVFVPMKPEFDLPLVSFYVIPTGMNKNDLAKIGAEMKRVHEELLTKKLMYVTLSTLKDSLSRTYPPYFLTISLTNSYLSDQNLDHILEVIELVTNKKAVSKEIQVSTTQTFQNSPHKQIHGDFLSKVFALCAGEGIYFKRSDAPTNFMDPTEVYKKFNFKLGHDPVSQQHLLQSFKTIIQLSPHWAHPYFIYQLAAGLDPYTLVGDYVASTLNTPMINYKDSPVFTLMENEVMQKFRQRIFGSPKGDGVMTDGGSMANQMAIALAKRSKIKKLGDLRKNGITGNKKFIVFISESGHYSTKKGNIIQSLGTEQLVLVETTAIGKMKVDDLKRLIDVSLKKGDIPFMVVITTGTTIYSAIDPVNEIIDVCKSYDLWCHVDGMFGGSLAWSDKHRPSLKGIERSDSFGIDIHKMLGSTMVCTILISPHENIFKDTFGTTVDLSTDFENSAEYDNSNGGKYWQVDKRNNMFKFWLLWKAKGRKGIEAHINHVMNNADLLVKEIKARKSRGFLPAIDKFEVTNICFYYIPPSMRSMQIDTPEWKKYMKIVSFEIEIQLTKKHILEIVSQSRTSKSGKTGTFIKFVMMSSGLVPADIAYLLDVVEYYGHKIDPASMTPANRNRIIDNVDKDRFEPYGNMPGPQKRNANRDAEVYPHPDPSVKSPRVAEPESDISSPVGSQTSIATIPNQGTSSSNGNYHSQKKKCRKPRPQRGMSARRFLHWSQG